MMVARNDRSLIDQSIYSDGIFCPGRDSRSQGGCHVSNLDAHRNHGFHMGSGDLVH